MDRTAPTPRPQQYGTTSTTTTPCVGVAAPGVVCGLLPIDLDQVSSLVVHATGNWATDVFNDPTSGIDALTSTLGSCELRLDDVAVPGAELGFGEQMAILGAVPVGAVGGALGSPFALTGFVPTATAGSHDVSLRCLQTDGTLKWNRVAITVTAAPLG